MLRVKDMYVSTDGIKNIEFENGYNFGPNYLVINYKFEEEPVKIEVKDFEEFVEVADNFCTNYNFAKGA